MVDSDTVWFKRFGIQQNYNKKDGKEMSGFNRDESAHELLLLQNYTALSSYYGIPEVISAIVAIMGNKYEADYNLQFLQPIKKVSSLPIRDLNIFRLFRRYKKGKSRSHNLTYRSRQDHKSLFDRLYRNPFVSLR